MKKISIYFVATVAMIAGFTSCIKEKPSNTPPVEYEELIAVITVQDAVIGKSLTGSESVHNARFNNGKVYFVDAAGVITKSFSIVETVSDATTQVKLEAGETATMAGVPNSSTKVYIVANVDATTNAALPATGAIASVLAVAVEVSDLAISTGSAAGDYVAAIPMGGNGNLTLLNGELQATVKPEPIGARIEIEKFVNKTVGAVNSYKVAGIFINNYYTKGTLAGVVDSEDLADNGDAILNPLTYVGGSTYYTAPLDGIVYDYNAAGLGEEASGNIIAGNNKVWGYNLLSSAASVDFPHIVVRFTEVVDGADSPVAGDKFVTVTGFVNGDDAPVSFVHGMIYAIEEFEFTELSDVPYAKEETVKVTVTPFEWGREVVKPGVN